MTVPITQSRAAPQRTLPERLRRFWNRPWVEKREVLSWRLSQPWNTVQSSIPAVKRMDQGFLWIAWNDVIRDTVLQGNFEIAERKFVERFLQPGMTVLDIGAYSGLYTLTASVRVGRAGHVIAFEPSPYQRKRLQWHVWLNRCGNVRIENTAIGGKEGEEIFFSVRGRSAGYSGLRPPEVKAATRPIPVRVTTLDSYLRQFAVGSVDFIKVDVEGGELDVFKGAVNLLKQHLRPVILCELEDIRTEVWGYKAKDAAAFVKSFGFRWFRPLPCGRLTSLGDIWAQNERNFVAVPEERMTQFNEIADEKTRP
jgi:FkbM family methyltransferase